MTQLGEIILCTGRVIEKCHVRGEPCIRLAVSARNQLGEIRLTGEALVALAD